MTNSTALFPGTFDPMTIGHLDLIERAARLFPKLIIAITDNKQKTPLFTLPERVALIEQELKAHDLADRVIVKPYSGLLMDFAKAEQAFIMIRGLRNVKDFEYESDLADLNHQLNPQIETLFLPTAPSLKAISSSMVKELSSYLTIPEIDRLNAFVPKSIAIALLKKLNQ